MLKLLNWRYAVYGLAALALSCFISYCFGVSKGRKLEASEQLVLGAKEAIKSSTEKDKVKHETRNLSDRDVNARLSAGGWLRAD